MRKRILMGILLVTLIFIASGAAFSEIKKKNYDELYKQVELFSDTMAIIQKEYIEETKPKNLIYGALKGMLTSLDPHSAFMDPDAYSELKIDTEGKFGGLGIEITTKDGLLTIITPIEDTPAWKAGLKPGDRIIKINDELTREMSLADAVKRMRGKTGVVVNLTILRGSENKLLDFKITRDIIKIKDIKYVRILENNVGYIRLVEFRENTLPEFNNALSTLSKQGMQALIVDLRNNPGGLLDNAVKITGRFVAPNKIIVYTKSRNKDQNLEFYSESKSMPLDLPMAILINEGSASGSEIMAGALQDYKRAIIIGTKSFGKGSVQTVIPLSDGSALRLTTSHYFTPSGKIINGKGVTPDILVEESKLPERLEEKKEKIKKDDEFNYKEDAQLIRAINTLRGIVIYKQSKL